MDYTYYTLWYYITVTTGYVLVASMAFIVGWAFKHRKTVREVQEIDGFALYKVAMKKKRDSAKTKAKREKRERQRILANSCKYPFRVFKG